MGERTEIRLLQQVSNGGRGEKGQTSILQQMSTGGRREERHLYSNRSVQGTHEWRGDNGKTSILQQTSILQHIIKDVHGWMGAEKEKTTGTSILKQVSTGGGGSGERKDVYIATVSNGGGREGRKKGKTSILQTGE